MLLITTSGFSQIYNTQVEAKIDLEKKSGFIEITGTAFNKSEISQSLRYVLSVIKSDPIGSNRSKNDQTGRIVLDPIQRSELSKTRININDKDRIIILLLVYNLNDELLGKDRIVLNGNAEDIEAANKEKEGYISQDAKYEAADGLVLRGIVIDETKTKPGRDFYREFEQKYRNDEINGNKIVTIKEIPILANTTAIRVLVGDVVIHSFIAKPQIDFKKENSKYAINQANKYFQQLEKNKNIIKRY